MNYSTESTTDKTPLIPKEIVIHNGSYTSRSSRSPLEQIVDGVANSFSITPLEWLSQETIQEGSLQGHAVSLTSSNVSSQECSLEDPLDFRMDWSEELENGLKSCIKQNPELFLIDDYIISRDSDSLCSVLTEEYEMDSVMSGLWDGEQHNISIPALVSNSEER